MVADANMIVEVGDEATSVVVEVPAYNILYSSALEFSGRAMDEAVVSYIQGKYNLLVGVRTAEVIRLEIGSAYPLDEPLTMTVRARHLTEGVPKTILLSDEEIRNALTDIVSTFVHAIRVVLEQIPKEFYAEIAGRGILLKGSKKLRNLNHRLSIETNLPVASVE